MGNLAHAVSLDTDSSSWPWRTDGFFPVMFRDPIVLQSTLKKEWEHLDWLLSPQQFGGSAGRDPTWLVRTWPHCLQTPSQVSPRRHVTGERVPGCRAELPLQGWAPFLQLVGAPGFDPWLWLLIAVVAKGRAMMGWQSLLARLGLLILHLRNIQARGLEQGRPWWVRNRNYIAR